MDYDFDAKQKGYRAPAWQAVDRMMKMPRGMRRVAILDTKQGLEVRHLVALGYRPENILAVNYNAAELAVMTKGLRADGIDGVRTKAGDFAAVLMKWDERLDVIGFDTTSNLRSESFVRLALPVEKHRPLCLVMVMLAGREQGRASSLIVETATHLPSRRDSLNQEAIPSHFSRIVVAFEASLVTAAYKGCHSHVSRLSWASYLSTSRQPMLWGVASMVPHPDGGRDRTLVMPPCQGGGSRLASALYLDSRTPEKIEREYQENVKRTERFLEKCRKIRASIERPPLPAPPA